MELLFSMMMRSQCLHDSSPALQVAYNLLQVQLLQAADRTWHNLDRDLSLGHPLLLQHLLGLSGVSCADCGKFLTVYAGGMRLASSAASAKGR